MSLLPEITEDAVGRLAGARDPRLKTVMAILIRHLHAAVREARPSEAEWMTAVEFLTRTGQTCDGTRQEFILLSDVLGVSMLIDAINHESGGEASDSTVLGPFYTGRQPTLPMGASILKRTETGASVTMRGRVLDLDGAPIDGALLEIWQTAPNSLYDVQDPGQPRGHMRASFATGPDGRYSFETVLPVSYPIPSDGPVGQLLEQMGRHPYRPAHIHFMISAPGRRRLVTHLFIDGDPYLESDAVFGVKSSLIVTPVEGAGGLAIDYDFKLPPQA